MATWTGVNVNTGAVELPKANVEGVTEEIYIAAVTTALASGDIITGPVVQGGGTNGQGAMFLTGVKAAVDALDSAASKLIQFNVGYIDNAGTYHGSAFIAAGNTIAGAGGIQSANVPASYGQTFANNITVAASITASAGTAVAGNFRLGASFTASP